MAEITQYLLDTKHRNRIKPNEDIVELCDDVERLLLLWDGALAMLHVEDPVEADFVSAQKFIDQAVAKMRELDISVTVKGHGAASHAVEQMCDTAQFGGLFDFDESWDEQYHQVGYRFDMKLRNRGSEVRKAQTREKWDRTDNLPTMLEASRKLVQPVVKRAGTIAREESTKLVKLERRENALS